MAEYIPIPRGTPITADTITDRFTAVQDEVNAIEKTSIESKSLDHQHFDSQIIFSGSRDIIGFGGPVGGIHYYANMDYGGQGWNANMTTGTDKLSIGWSVIRTGGQWKHFMGGSAQSGQELQVDFPTSYMPGDVTNGIAGILVMANIEVVKLGPAYIIDNSVGPAMQHGTDHIARFALQARVDTGSGPTWRVIDGTHRFLEADTLDQQDGASGSGATTIIDKKCDVAIRALVPDNRGTWRVDAVRAIVAIRRAHVPGDQFLHPTCVGLKNCNLSAVVFHGHQRSSW